MGHYYLNRKEQANGDHEVHISTCNYLPATENLIDLGYFGSCVDAVKEAKRIYPQSDGCYYCCPSCHKS